MPSNYQNLTEPHSSPAKAGAVTAVAAVGLGARLSKRSTGVPVAEVPTVKTLLAEANRTYTAGTESIEDRFVEIRPGMLKLLLARSHHVIQGRRGTGKSTVLSVLLHRARDENIPVASIDMETHKQRHYPDVLIEILIEVLVALRPNRAQHALRRRVKQLKKLLRQILSDPSVIESRLLRESERRSSFSFEAVPLWQKVKGKFGAELSRSAESTQSGEQTSTKIDRLDDIATLLSRTFGELAAAGPTGKALLFIDDFYFIATHDQPYVIDYLHRVSKGTGVWLRIGGVGSRMRLYKEGDPPIGVQSREDVAPVPLDVTLEKFVAAKSFLEKVLNGVLQNANLHAADLMNPGARDRIVLACGGAVPRDYLNLLSDSLDLAVDRHAESSDENDSIKIKVEDINRATKNRFSQKEEEDLNSDAANDAPAIRKRWQDIQKFAADNGNTNYVLFRQEDLSETEWGGEVLHLENLRLLHRIGVGVPNTSSWRQVRVVIMMIDLAAVMNQRLSSQIIEFWKGQREFDRLRRSQWVYTPGWDSAPKNEFYEDDTKQDKKSRNGSKGSDRADSASREQDGLW